MLVRSLALALSLATTAVSASAFAAPAPTPSEPSWCNVETFKSFERETTTPYLKRAHTFQVGKLKLVGLGVGASDHRWTRYMAESNSKFQAYEKSCTFYFNDGNPDAITAFNQQYVSSPIFKSPSSGIAQKYEDLISPMIDKNTVNMIGCAQKHGYLAMGCDGMKHRGPSVFAMFLAYSGCSAKSATKIANEVWGNNFVPTNTRESIAQKGFEAGARNPAGRRQLQRLFSAK